jgi:hypothetical protein
LGYKDAKFATVKDLRFDVLKEICKFLVDFNDYQLTISKKDVSTIGMVFTTYNILLGKLEQVGTKIADARFAQVLPTLKVTMHSALVDDFMGKINSKLNESLTQDEQAELASLFDGNVIEQLDLEELQATEQKSSSEYFGELLDKVFETVELSQTLTTLDLSPEEIIGAAARSGHVLLKKHYNNISDYHIAASILDPRFNLEYIAKTCSLTEYDLDEYVFPPIQRLFEQTKRDNDLEVVNNNTVQLLIPQATVKSPFKLPLHHPPVPKQKKKTQTDLEIYFNEDPIDISIDPINWWYTNRMKYKYLSILAIESLIIPPTTITVEQLFSQASYLCTPIRNRMLDETIRITICLKLWYKAYMKNKITEEKKRRSEDEVHQL